MSQIIQISNFFRYQNPIKFNLKFLTKIFILLLFAPSVLFAQSTLSERNKTVEISGLTFSFDEFSIIPNSLIIYLEDSIVISSEKYLLNEIDANITGIIISLAHVLDLKVIAEGVENAQQMKFLESKGCDIAQGYLISEPISAKDFAQAFLLNRSNRDK